MTATPLDTALARMAENPLPFWDLFAASELFLLLESEAEEDAAPRVFPLEDGAVVLAFDREERLAAFAGGPAPYAALSGRRLAAMLSERGLGLGLNLGTEAETVLPADALSWLARTLAPGPTRREARAQALSAPQDLPPRLLSALDGRLARATGLAGHAWLATATWEDGTGLLLAIVDPRPGAEDALARAASEALALSGLDDATLDIAFLAPGDPLLPRLERVGLRIDLPAPEPATPAAPGSDPEAPPRLR